MLHATRLRGAGIPSATHWQTRSMRSFTLPAVTGLAD